ncbi:uncharacterized protein LOC110826213 [Carica papaya]|uniref:uncharacterized protein LOC110826213 n=1 Tax=Carica papaya TaxID=3649 RepID=UPI000B8D12E9|nr:uncharacterized protein LOC110826213 [Carica papaya]
MRDPAESMLVLAFWFWLEEKHIPDLVYKMRSIPDHVVDLLADEAAACIKSLESNNPPSPVADGGMPLTDKFFGTDMSFVSIYQQKYAAVTGIKNFLGSVCSRIFPDILHLVLGNRCFVSLNQSLVIPGFPHPTFGAVHVMPRACDNGLPNGGIWGWHPSSNVTENDRTLFLTFSRGFPVTAAEVADVFSRTFGDNFVETVIMQDNIQPHEQPLFAKLVLHSVEQVDIVLSGCRIAKFKNNGKHIWARKYEVRE